MSLLLSQMLPKVSSSSSSCPGFLQRSELKMNYRCLNRLSLDSKAHGFTCRLGNCRRRLQGRPHLCPSDLGCRSWGSCPSRSGLSHCPCRDRKRHPGHLRPHPPGPGWAGRGSCHRRHHACRLPRSLCRPVERM